MKSSSGFLAALILMFFIAPIPAGYIAAKIAPQANLLNGALSVSVVFVLLVYEAIWGGGGDSTVHTPYWLDVFANLTTYTLPLPAILGAYIWQLRASRGAFAVANIQQEYHASAELQREKPMQLPPREIAMSPTAKNKARRFGGVGLGTFIFILSHFLLTQHEQGMLLLAILAVVALILVFAFASKALKGTSS